MSTADEIVEKFKKDKVVPSKISSSRLKELLQMICDLRDEVDRLIEDVEQKERDIRCASYDPKVCSCCGWRGRDVLENGGRCDSCM